MNDAAFIAPHDMYSIGRENRYISIISVLLEQIVIRRLGAGATDRVFLDRHP